MSDVPRRHAARLKEGSLESARDRLLRQVDEALDSAVPDASEEGWLKALSDPSPARRILALEMVCRFSGEHAVHVLGGMLGDPDPSVRCTAAAAVARIGNFRLVSGLIMGIDDPDPLVRRACERALHAVAKRSIDFTELEDPQRRSRAIAELLTWWKRERLAELLAE